MSSRMQDWLASRPCRSPPPVTSPILQPPTPSATTCTLALDRRKGALNLASMMGPTMALIIRGVHAVDGSAS